MTTITSPKPTLITRKTDPAAENSHSPLELAVKQVGPISIGPDQLAEY